MRFSVITVCLNPGEKLYATLESVLSQTYEDVEVILKDGGSSDGSVERWLQENESRPGREKIRVFSEKDKGIYDAMNQAAARAEGDFLIFLNCGDVFRDEKVLERTAGVLEEEKAAGADMDRMVLYGDTFSEKNEVTIASAPRITGFTCYRNIPCHQSCFYSAWLCREKPYDLQYRIRADYDHFLWCFYRAGAKMRRMDFPVSSYEGGGFSESRENRIRDRQEHRQIAESYMGIGALFGYRAAMACTLAPLRRAMAESRVFSGIYHWLKERIYRRKLWFLAAFVFFVLEMALLVWPVGWLGEDQVNFLSGDGSWDMESREGSFACCQEFRPEYKNLKSIGIVISGEENLSGGSAVIAVADSENRILFETRIPYEEVELGSFTDIEMDLPKSPGDRCYLSVYLEEDEKGRVPVLKACSTAYPMAENIILEQEEALKDAQLVTRYHYEDVVTGAKFFRAFCICAITAAGIAFGLPGNKRLRMLLGILLLAAVPWVLGRRLELLAVDANFLLPFSMKWNMGLMYLFELILLLCTQSFRVSICGGSLALTLLYSANYFVFSFRGEPLRLNDLSAIGTAARVVGRYSLQPNSHMAMAWCIQAFFLVYGIQTAFSWKKRKKGRNAVMRLTALASGCLLAAVSGHRLLYTDMLVEAGFMYTHGFDQNMNYQFNGYLVASCMDIQDSRVVKPQGYSTERVEELLENAEESRAAGEGDINPHIILIMNESFADLRVLGNLQLSEENMAFFNSLNDNVVRGYVNASVLGGGTANSEFEVLTGCSMGFLPPSYYAYQQCMVGEMPSLVSDMKKAGYTTYSVHPEVASNWNRDRVYQYFGFENSLWIEDFPEAETLHYGVTDLETYRKVEELYENRRPEEKLFIFNLTVQNHGGYSRSDVERSVEALNASSEEADIYLSLMKESDQAFSQLIAYFEKEEEPVLICIFGDHQPKLEDSFYESVYRQTEGLGEKDKRLNLFKTPFLIWANYDIPEQEGLDIGMSYLGALLLDAAGVPGSAFFAFLQQYRMEYPIITVNGYEDTEGNHESWSGENSELSEYRMLQYNHLFDRNRVQWGF